MARKRSRYFLTFGTVALVVAALVFAFWPRAMIVDLGEVTRGPMQVAISEEGRTRVHDAYVVSTPVAGRLLRVQVQPGDRVVRGNTVAEMRPTNPAALDVRTREQARAAVTAAEAALRVARANLNAAIADRDLAEADLARTRTLAESGTVSQAALDRAERAARAANAQLDTARAAISMRIAELENAQAQLIGFDDQGLAKALSEKEEHIPLVAPIDGRILRIMQQSETTLPAGAPVMEIGDIESDLEVVVELLSTDAVKVVPGHRVLIEDWGGPDALAGEVVRIDPFGVTKFSALGVEEQRVNAVIAFTGSADERSALGHGYRVEVRIIVWEADDAVILPSSALFRDGDGWSVFAVRDGRAARQAVEIGRNNGIRAQVLSGLEPGDSVILYPPSGLTEGQKVTQRVIE